jgi:hypothetical protein
LTARHGAAVYFDLESIMPIVGLLQNLAPHAIEFGHVDQLGDGRSFICATRTLMR